MLKTIAKIISEWWKRLAVLAEQGSLRACTKSFVFNPGSTIVPTLREGVSVKHYINLCLSRQRSRLLSRYIYLKEDERLLWMLRAAEVRPFHQHLKACLQILTNNIFLINPLNLGEKYFSGLRAQMASCRCVSAE